MEGCSREVLTLLSLEHPDVLNVSLRKAYGRAPDRPGPPTTHAEHARYKYLLNLDGIAASSRLATLLAIDSLTLKQESVLGEWYYPALAPCVHYVPIYQRDTADVLEVLAALNASAASQAAARAITANANAFAARFLTEDAVYAHWQRILDRYVALYRGPADPEAAAEAAAWAERVGQEAGKVGSAINGPTWHSGGDAARAFVQAARLGRDMAGGSVRGVRSSGGGGETASGSSGSTDKASLQGIAAEPGGGQGHGTERRRRRRWLR